jgi:hypothetical protein
MIVMDSPHDWGGAFNRRWGPSVHLVSDLPGPAGSRELAAFMAAMGVAWAPIQHADTYREHHDLAGEWIDRARSLGAVTLDRATFVGILRRKREALGV